MYGDLDTSMRIKILYRHDQGEVMVIWIQAWRIKILYRHDQGEVMVIWIQACALKFCIVMTRGK